MGQDNVLLVGSEDAKLAALLRKLGYSVLAHTGDSPLAALFTEQVIDIVIVDSRNDDLMLELCQFLRADSGARTVPIVCIPSDPDAGQTLQELNLNRLEITSNPVSLGDLAAKVATQLRLRKMRGATNTDATLEDVNVALRDLNERLRKEREEARAIQLSLLPRELPVDARFEFAAHYQPVDEVGGDWYFVQKVENDCLAIQVADVTGHGLAAAFVGSMTKLALSAADRSDPKELLTGANRLMTPQLPAGRFVTMVSCLYNFSTGELEHASAGHPFTLIHRAQSGQAVELKNTGFALGFFEDSEYQANHAQLEKDDILVVFTDGLTEAQNRSGECYSHQRVEEALRHTRVEMSAQQILSLILEDLDKFREERLLKDDLTLVVLRRR